MNALTLSKGDVVFDATILAQSIAADPSISIWASANAGAGKTKVLIDRIARLLLSGSKPGRILAVTYTKAAATEMQTRLYDKLGGWTIADDVKLRAALSDLDPTLELDSPATLARARSLFAAALETPGGLKIQTIHAFCQTILQRFPLEAGVPPSFQILDDATGKSLAEKALDVAARQQPDAFAKLAALTTVNDDINALRLAIKQRAALERATQNPTLVRIRIAESLGLDQDDTPEAICTRAVGRLDLDGFARAASILETGKESDKKIAKAFRLAIATPDPMISVLALAALIFTSEGDVRQKQIYTKDMGKHAAVVAVLGPHDGWPSNFCNQIEAIYNDMQAAKLLEKSAALTVAAIAYKKTWAEAKQAMGALDFDDLVAATANLLSHSDGAARWVLYKLDAGIEHILIDEAQDTSPEQWDLMAPLFGVLEQEQRDKPRTRFVVGDEKQSIFSFQGARPQRFGEERTAFQAQGEIYQDGREALSFELSFRTGQTILDAVDAVWSVSQSGQLPLLNTSPEENPPFERKYAFATRHSAFRSGQRGGVELWPLLRVEKNELQAEAWDQSLDLEREDSARNRLADQIALELKSRFEAGFCVWDKDTTRPMRPSDIMILVKTRGAFFHQLIRRLKFHKVPVAGADRIKLIEDQGVEDLISMARFALLPDDDFNTACVLKGAFCGLVNDDEHLFPLLWERGSSTLYQRLCASTDPRHRHARTLLETVKSHAGRLPPYEFFASLLELILPGQNLSGWQAVTQRLGREVREPIEALLSRALDFGATSAPTLHAFLSQIQADAADVKREMDQDGAGVRVMTIHGAKGLEAPVVILPETTSPIQKGDSDIQFDEGAEAFLWSPFGKEDTSEFKIRRDMAQLQVKSEDSRLLYVAMTRARDLLILCGHQHGAAKDGMPSECWYRTFEQTIPIIGEGQTIEQDSFSYRLWGSYPPASLQSEVEAETHFDPLPDWYFSAPKTSSTTMRRIAPSALGLAMSEPAAISPLVPDARKRFLRGRLIHELLQRLPDLPQQDWETAALKRLVRESDLDQATRLAIVSETCAVLRDPKFAGLFGPHSRAEAAIAGRGPGLPDDMVVNGSVDRLVVTDTDVLVLDFKTNRPPPLRVEDVAQIYLNQMAAYRALLQATWPDKRIRCTLLWTDGPRLMELPDAILDQALQVIAALPR